jgi:hypothetical protein
MKTCKSLEEEVADGIRATPAWLKLDVTSQCYGISRSGLYSLIRDGKIRSACLRDQNKSRGTRIVNVQSLEDYISKHEGKYDETKSEKVPGPKGRKNKKAEAVPITAGNDSDLGTL